MGLVLLLVAGVFFILILGIGWNLLLLGFAGGGLLLIIGGIGAISQGDVYKGIGCILLGALMSKLGFSGSPA